MASALAISAKLSQPVVASAYVAQLSAFPQRAMSQAHQYFKMQVCEYLTQAEVG